MKAILLLLSVLLLLQTAILEEIVEERVAKNPFFTKDKLHILYPFDINGDNEQLGVERPYCTTFLKQFDEGIKDSTAEVS